MKKFFCSVLVAVFVAGTAGAWAAQSAYDIKMMTPQVKTALEARKARFAALKNLKTVGSVGENNRGYLESFVRGAAANECQHRA
ncbi:MAG: hypothetical protein WCI27_09990, partial [Candidatus Omnitrophota bacterium]